MELRETRELDTVGYKDLTFLKWSPPGEHLAIGTAKGALLVYDKQTLQKKELGRQKRRIVCGDWNQDESLAYASDDRQITICGVDGEAIDQIKVKCRPLSVSFGGTAGSIVSVNMEGKTILLYSLLEKDNALELAFQKRYGSIVSYRWFADEKIIVAFSSGFLVVISTAADEIGREQFCGRFFDDELRDIAYCPATKVVAICDSKCVKLISMPTWREVKAYSVEHGGNLDSLAFADNGRLLSVSSKSGCLHTFLVREDLPARPHHLDPQSILIAALVKPVSCGSLLAVLATFLLGAVGFSSWLLDCSFLELYFAALGDPLIV